MKYRNNRQGSLILLYAAHFLFCVLVGILIYSGMVGLYDRNYARTYPSIQTAMNYKKGVETDNWKGFTRFCPNGQLLVYGSDGFCIYYSDEELEKTIDPNDLELIFDISADEFYDLMIEQDKSGERRYRLNKMRYDDDGNLMIVDAVVLDEQYRILSGDMFPDRTCFTEHEMQIIQGIFQNNYDIERKIYYNSSGQKRIMVFISPQLTSAGYDKMAHAYTHYGIIALVLFMVSFLLSMLHLWMLIKQNIIPMLDSVKEYSKGVAPDVRPPMVMRELQPISDAITTLMVQVSEAQDKHRKEEQTRRRIIASLSHDLKTPIAVIMGYTQAFVDDRIHEEDRSSYYEMMMEKCQLAVDMIDSMAEYTKMEHPDFQIHPEETEICEFVRQYLMSIYDRLTDHGVDLYPEIPDEEIHTAVDRRMLIRIFNNLISNTRKYNPDGCRMRIIVGEENGILHLSVADDGIGIQEDLRETVFQAFITSNEARTTGQGTGLGLSIVQMAVKAHQGTILLKDPKDITDGYTTEFEITMPICHVEE